MLLSPLWTTPFLAGRRASGRGRPDNAEARQREVFRSSCELTPERPEEASSIRVPAPKGEKQAEKKRASSKADPGGLRLIGTLLTPGCRGNEPMFCAAPQK